MKEESKIEYWLSNKRFLIITIILFTMFLILMGVLVWQGKNIARDPYSICAEKQGDNVLCYVQGTTQQRTYSPNGSIIDKELGGF